MNVAPSKHELPADLASSPMTVGSQRWGCRLVPAVTSHALILIGCAIFVCFEVSAAATVVDVYRMIQVRPNRQCDIFFA